MSIVVKFNTELLKFEHCYDTSFIVTMVTSCVKVSKQLPQNILFWNCVEIKYQQVDVKK